MTDDDMTSRDRVALRVEGEFAAVELWVDIEANGSRLAIRDLKTDHIGFLDALELEALAWSRHPELRNLLDPGRAHETTEKDGDLQ